MYRSGGENEPQAKVKPALQEAQRAGVLAVAILQVETEPKQQRADCGAQRKERADSADDFFLHMTESIHRLLRYTWQMHGPA